MSVKSVSCVADGNDVECLRLASWGLGAWQPVGRENSITDYQLHMEAKKPAAQRVRRSDYQPDDAAGYTVLATRT